MFTYKKFITIQINLVDKIDFCDFQVTKNSQCLLLQSDWTIYRDQSNSSKSFLVKKNFYLKAISVGVKIFFL